MLPSSSPHNHTMPSVPCIAQEVRKAVENTDYWKEQQAFDAELADWQRYVDIFISTHGRAPVVYDLYCGEGGYSRGARAVGCECYGFDIATACKHRYENEMCATSDPVPSCMTFIAADVNSPHFWDDLLAGSVNGVSLPLPDIIHASPPCAPYSRSNL